MTGLHLFVDGSLAPDLAACLRKTCGVFPSDITSCLTLGPDKALTSFAAQYGIAVVERIDSVPFDDFILIAGDNIDMRIGQLFEAGRCNLYNGNTLIERGSPASRFADQAHGLFLGPAPFHGRDPGAEDALRFDAGALTASQIPRHKLFIVNSLPKSGTLWMAGLLESILGVTIGEQIIVSHVADIEVDWKKYNNHGAVTLVRDMRDVVVSWFHNASRTDLELGYRTPRYPDIGSFYREFFISTLSASDRYYRGDLVRWIDKNCASYVPLVRFEDLHASPSAALEKVLNAWRIDYDSKALVSACTAMSFQMLGRPENKRDGYLGKMLASGHLRRGEPGAWRTELPEDIIGDIQHRFSDYQSRLGYT